MKTTVFCRTRFVGYHRWTSAPKELKYLRDYHRHQFHVELEVLVDHADRAVEFIQLKQLLDSYLFIHWCEERFEDSCEMIAKAIRDEFTKHAYLVYYVEVSEDGENGGRIYNV